MKLPPKIDKIEFFKNKIYYVYGPPQMGKALAEMQIVFKAKEAGTNSTVLVRNINADLQQLVARIERHNQQYKSSHLGSTEVLNRFTTNAKIAELLEKHPTLPRNLIQEHHLIMLGNSFHAERLKRVLQKSYLPAACRGVLIIDEADLIGLDFDKNSTKLNNIEEHMQALRSYFHTIIMFSATPFANIFTSGNNRITDMIVLDLPSDYFGVSRFTHVPTAPYVHTGPKGTSYDPDVDSSNLNLVMKDLLTQDLGRLLITTTRRTSEHGDTIKWIQKNYPTVTCIEFNGSGNTPRAHIKGSGNKPVYASAVAHIHTIGDALQYVKDDHVNTGDHTHVVIVGGQMASRGISFVNSRVDEPGQWHLTHQYLLASRNATMDTLIQMMRLCGRYPGTPTLKLFCEEEVWKHVTNMDRDFARVTADMERYGPSNQKFYQLQDEMRRKWVATRKMNALDFQPGVDNRKSYSSEEDFGVEMSDTPLITKRFDLKKNKPLMKIVKQAIEKLAAERKASADPKHWDTAKITAPVRDAVVAVLHNHPEFTGNFEVNIGENYQAKMPHTIHWYFQPNFASHKDWGLSIVMDDASNPYVLVKDKRVRCRRVEEVIGGDYAYHDEGGRITEVKAHFSPMAVKK